MNKNNSEYSIDHLCPFIHLPLTLKVEQNLTKGIIHTQDLQSILDSILAGHGWNRLNWRCLILGPE